MLNVFAYASVSGELNLTFIYRNWLDLYFVNFNSTDTFETHGEYAVPKLLHDREVTRKPFTVAWNLDDDKLFWRSLFVL